MREPDARGKVNKSIAVIVLSGVLFLCGCGPQRLSASSGAMPSGGIDMSGYSGPGETESEEEAAQRISVMLPSYNGNTFPSAAEIREVESEIPNTDIVLEYYPEDEYFVMLKARLATGNAPDIFSIQPGYAGFNGTVNLAESGYLEPVDDLPIIEKLRKSSLAKNLLQVNGTVYGASLGNMAFAVIYHKEIFRRENLEVPQNWEEFLHVCAVLQKDGIQPVVQGNRTLSGFQVGLYQIAANQVYAKNTNYPLDMLSGRVTFRDDGVWDTVFERFFLLYEQGYINPDWMQLAGEEAGNRFAEGKAAMQFSTLQEMNLPEGGDVGAFPLPGNDEGKPTYCVIGNGSGLGLSSESRHMDKAREVLNLLLDKYLSSKSVTRSDGQKENVFRDAYQNGRYYEPCNYYWRNEVEVVMQQKIADYLLQKGTSVREIENAMQEEFDR